MKSYSAVTAILATLALVQQAHGQTSEWQTSYPALAQRVESEKAKYGPPKSGGAILIAMAEGLTCSNPAPTLPGLGAIKYNAKFKGVRQLTPTDIVAVDLDIDGDVTSDAVVAVVVSSPNAVGVWQGLSRDTRIEFVANVNCIQVLDMAQFGRGLVAFITLNEAQPAPAT